MSAEDIRLIRVNIFLFKEAVMSKKYEIVSSIEALEAKLAKMRKAEEIYSRFTQEQVDENPACENGVRRNRYGMRRG